jgi:hypothetical protein
MSIARRPSRRKPAQTSSQRKRSSKKTNSAPPKANALNVFEHWLGRSKSAKLPLRGSHVETAIKAVDVAYVRALVFDVDVQFFCPEFRTSLSDYYAEHNIVDIGGFLRYTS